MAGTSGAGKTSVAIRLAAALAVPHIEIDALFHGSGWTRRPEFAADVEAFSAGPAWVTEWQYGSVRPLLAERADLLVWLDLPRMRVMGQVIARTLRRRLGRQVLWNGNVEPPLWTVATNREHIVRWAWTTHHQGRRRVQTLPQAQPELTIVQLGNWSDVTRWLDGPVRDAVGPR